MKAAKIPSLKEELAIYNMFLTLAKGESVTEHVKSEKTALSRLHKILKYIPGGRITACDLFSEVQLSRFSTREEFIDCMVTSNWANCQNAHYLSEEYDLLKELSMLKATGASYFGGFSAKHGKYHRFEIIKLFANDIADYKKYFASADSNEPWVKFAEENYLDLLGLDCPFICFWIINGKGQVARWSCIADKGFKSHKKKDMETVCSLYSEYCEKVFGTKSKSNLRDSFQYKKTTDKAFKAEISAMKSAIANPSTITIEPATEKQAKMICNISPIDGYRLNKYQAMEIIDAYYHSDNFNEIVDWYNKKLN